MTYDLADVRAETIEQSYTIVNNPRLGFGDPTPEHLDLINTRAPEPLAAGDVFILPTIPSTKAIDSYLTRMTEKTLRNYVADATAGFAFMNQHRTPKRSFLGDYYEGELPIGRSFHGEFRGEGEDQHAFTLSYLLRNHFPNGREKAGTEDFIRGIRGGIWPSISVGFYLGPTGRYLCGLCESDHTNPWAESGCDHVPGVEYDGALAFDWVDDAHCAEQSLVYKGANPQAMVARAERLLDRGRINAAQARQFEDRTGVRMFSRSAGVTLDRPARTDLLTELREGRRELAQFRTQLTAGAVQTIGDRGPIKQHDAPLAPAETPWDGPGERAKAEPAHLRQMAAWMDPAQADVKDGYKFLHHQADGNHATVKRGVDNAMARLGNSDIPAADKSGVEAHLRHHQAQFKQPAGGRAEDSMEIGELVRALGLEDADSLADVRSQVEAIRSERDEAKTRLLALEPRAKLGDAYLDDLVNQALVAGARAMGEHFPREAQERTLRAMADIEAIKQMRDGWQAQGESQFGRAGTDHYRLSQPIGDVTAGGNFERFMPAERERSVPEAYQTGRTAARR